MALGHALHAHGQGQGYRGQHALRHKGNDHADGKNEGIDKSHAGDEGRDHKEDRAGKHGKEGHNLGQNLDFLLQGAERSPDGLCHARHLAKFCSLSAGSHHGSSRTGRSVVFPSRLLSALGQFVVMIPAIRRSLGPLLQ